MSFSTPYSNECLDAGTIGVLGNRTDHRGEIWVQVEPGE